MNAYDPLDYENLARSVVNALLRGPQVALPPSIPFDGSGVYAIYYLGDFTGYSRLAEQNSPPPIYVGKAVPTGARKGGGRVSSGKELFNRLAQHAKNLEQVENLALEHFTCRYLVVMPVWITLAERFLVEHYRPVWNVEIEGFGNHDPGAGRRAMKRPVWDILHPGRPWAARLSADESFEQVLSRLQDFFKKHG
jgi:hypothetical protein